ncbi:hypothetical protein BGX33_010008 [Mortierella sp. NVP41]|nr:hypothetical protein BGX33_010008 [Mortierella sp. NVP41]
MDLEWPMIDIPQELREMRGEDDSTSRSNAQANAIKDPSSSNTAFALNVWVSMAIVISAVITTIETIPSFRSTDNKIWFYIETIMVVLFTIELIARIICHSDSFKQLKKFVFCKARQEELDRLCELYSSTIIMTIEVMIVAIKRSMDALSALFFFLITGTMLFSTLLYFAERGEWDDDRKVFVDANNNPSTFDSIPSAFWFVMVTITTTGYGDMVPTTFIGKLISFPAMMCGILLITLPSIIIGRNFTLVWEAMQQYRRKAAANTREQDVDESGDEPRRSFDSSHSYEGESSQPGYSSLTANSSSIPGQQEVMDRLQAMTQVLKHNQQTMDSLQRILESHDLVPKKSPFEDPTRL